MTNYEVVDLGGMVVTETTPVVAGPRGRSAYEVAVANGFVGTEAEWLASLAAEGGGTVDSVNGEVGAVVLDAADVGAETPTGAQSKVDTHAADTTGVHGIADTSVLATTADVSSASTADRARANHTGTQAASTITGLGTAATANTGTGATNVILGNDARLTDSRTPTAHTHAASDVNSGTLAVARLGTGTPAAGKYVDGGTGAWTTLPSSSGGGGLYLCAPAEGTTSAAYTTASTTDADVASAVFTQTFTVPASGIVEIDQSGYANWNQATGGYEWTVRESGVVVAIASIHASSTGSDRARVTHRITGLTPGATKTYTWGFHRSGTSGTHTIFTGGNAGTTGNARMSVRDGGNL